MRKTDDRTDDQDVPSANGRLVVLIVVGVALVMAGVSLKFRRPRPPLPPPQPTQPTDAVETASAPSQ